jgi:imidazolonepropionase-like amidohydrolase
VWQTLFVLMMALAGVAPPTETPSLVLTGAKVLDTAREQLLEGYDVLIAGDRISRMAPSGELPGPADATLVDLAGLTLLPGLIDLHSHLLLHPYNEASWQDQVLRESLELRTVRAVAAMRATLEAGFTTLRDMGTEGASYADVGLRDAVNQHIVPGPRVFASTRALVATGCYGPSGFDPRWEMPIGAQVADGVDGVRRAVREQIAHGADWIKVYADYRRRAGDPPTPTYSQEELNAIVDEAHSAGLRVAAHATTDDAIRRCVRAGVSTIEHGSEVSEDVLQLMRDHSVALCPTLAASEAIARYAGWSPGQPDPPRLVSAKAMFQRALKSGVTIACGSDVGVFPHGENVRELELMVEYGMSPAEAVKAATVTAAAVLGRSEDLGRIADGFLADLVAVEGDPLKNISALRKPTVVIKGGKIASDRR